MVKLEKPDKQGRNELCACGSGLKHKKCCGKLSEPTMRDVLKCLYLMLDMINKNNVAFRKGMPVEFPKTMLATVPKDFIEKMICRNEQNKLVLFVEHEKSVIEIPTIKQIKQIRSRRKPK